MPSRELTAGEIVRLHAIALCDVRTIKRWWAGEKVWGSTEVKLEAAAKRLKLHRPNGQRYSSRA